MPEGEDGKIASIINRPISKRITRYLVKNHPNVTPNQISILCFSLGVLGAFFYPLYLPLIAGVLLQISSILDGCDGEIARAFNRQSKFGEFFDSVLDRYVDVVAIIGITFFLFQITPFNLLLNLILLSFLALAGSVMVSYTAAAVRKNSLSFTRTVESRDVRIFVIFLGSIAAQFVPNALFLVLIYLAVVCNLAVIIRLQIVYKHFSKNDLGK
ncbi:MAG: CDP-alcohol phosphatidyltransferase family protein [Candidatus Ranarchaeia archaeon]